MGQGLAVPRHPPAGPEGHLRAELPGPGRRAASGLQTNLEVATTGLPPELDRRWELQFDSASAAANELGGAFPGGQTSLFQGLWTDPVTGIAYARARWYDARNATWLSEDPEDDIDSPNLYAAMSLQPQMVRDPSGRSAWTAYRSSREFVGSALANSRVQGAFQLAQGATEIAVGAAAAETGVGLLAIAHGSDTSAAGIVALITGESQQTLTQQAATGLASAAGADPTLSGQIGFLTDMAVGTAASAMSIRHAATRGLPRSTLARPSLAADAAEVGAKDAVLSQAEAKALGGPNRGLIFVRENLGDPRSAAMRAARDFESATPGAVSDIASRSRIAPTLRFDNPGGLNYVRWDGHSTLSNGFVELIDAKTRIVPFATRRGPFISSGVRSGLLARSRAIVQNEGFRGVIELPTEVAAREARLVLRRLGIFNLHVRVR